MSKSLVPVQPDGLRQLRALFYARLGQLFPLTPAITATDQQPVRLVAGWLAPSRRFPDDPEVHLSYATVRAGETEDWRMERSTLCWRRRSRRVEMVTGDHVVVTCFECLWWAGLR